MPLTFENTFDFVDGFAVKEKLVDASDGRCLCFVDDECAVFAFLISE